MNTLFNARPRLRARLQITVSASPSDELASQTPAPRVEQLAADRNVRGPGPDCLDFVASNSTLDRFHEIIEPTGWRLDNYRRNPVFQNAHNYHDVVFTLGKALITEVRPAGPGVPEPHLFQRIQFATDVNPIARIAYGLYKGGFLNSVSVGFIPLRWEDLDAAKSSEPDREHLRSDRGHSCPQQPSLLQRARLNSDALETEDLAADKNVRGPATRGPELKASLPRRRYLEQELLEVSAVAIPANPEALALGLKSGAIEKADVRSTLELLRQIISPKVCRSRRPRGSDRLHLFDFAQELHRILRGT